jgi:low affinity Fe/Cu permease
VEPVIQTRPFSRVLHRVDRIVSHSAAAGVVGALVGGFIVALAIEGFPESWEVAFSTIAASITLVMVFVLHHTQRREQIATQLKLDELIRAMKGARNELIDVEDASDEVVELHQRHFQQLLDAAEASDPDVLNDVPVRRKRPARQAKARHASS